MTYDRAEIALSRARHDYMRAVQAAMSAETDAARKRHIRRARTAETRIRDARRDLARLGCDLNDAA